MAEAASEVFFKSEDLKACSLNLQTKRLATLLKKTPTQGFSCEMCEIFKNTYFEEHLRMTASTYWVTIALITIV